VGKLWSARVDALAAMGGLGALVHHLGEDHEMARRLRSRGLRVVPVPLPVTAWVDRAHLGEAVRRAARWMLVIRAQRPWLLPSYPLLFCNTPLLLGLASLGLAARPTLSVAAALAAVAARLSQSALARLFSSSRPGPWRCTVDAVLGDLVLWLALCRSLVDRRLEWRGQALVIGRDGLLHSASRANDRDKAAG
jgi:ceramide glucosyltransferase